MTYSRKLAAVDIHIHTLLQTSKYDELIHANIFVPTTAAPYGKWNSGLNCGKYDYLISNTTNLFQVVFLVYDISNYESFSNIVMWLDTVKNILNTNTDIAVIANKSKHKSIKLSSVYYLS